MSFTEAIKSVFTQYIGFKGRARRSEYWYFFLLNIIVGIILAGVPTYLTYSIGGYSSMANIFNILNRVWNIGTFLPGLAVAFRRLHDAGKSGWCVLFAIIPIIGWIPLLIWLTKDSDPGDNPYGPNPKGNNGPYYQY